MKYGRPSLYIAQCHSELFVHYFLRLVFLSRTQSHLTLFLFNLFFYYCYWTMSNSPDSSSGVVIINVSDRDTIDRLLRTGVVENLQGQSTENRRNPSYYSHSTRNPFESIRRSFHHHQEAYVEGQEEEDILRYF